MVHKTRGGTACSMTSGVLFGAGSSMTITVIGSWILGKILNAEILEWEQIGYWIMLLIFISASTGASVAISKIKVKRMVSGISVGSLYFTVLLMMTALFFDGKYNAIGETACLIFGGSMLPVLIKCRNTTAKNKKSRRRYSG